MRPHCTQRLVFSKETLQLIVPLAMEYHNKIHDREKRKSSMIVVIWLVQSLWFQGVCIYGKWWRYCMQDQVLATNFFHYFTSKTWYGCCLFKTYRFNLLILVPLQGNIAFLFESNNESKQGQHNCNQHHSTLVIIKKNW